MQAYIRCQDFSSSSLGIKRLMPQANLSPLTTVTAAVSVPTSAPPTPTTPGSSNNKTMPAITRETLALRLRQNWLAKHPVDTPPPTTTSGMDDSLTSLNWLQNLNIMKIPNPTPPASPEPDENVPQYTPSMQVNPNAILNMGGGSSPTNAVGTIRIKQEPGVTNNVVAPPRITHFMDVMPSGSSGASGMDKIDYKSNPCVKPPYSYATLICMAMKETKKNKITLAGIYSWITENFMYYKVADPSWQNSIRHNLSLNKCFQKVPRRKDEPGKGGFWRINPEYEDMFINGIFKKRRGSTNARDVPLSVAPPLKKMRREMDDPEPVKVTPHKVEVKKEPCFTVSTDMLDNAMDFNWNSILSQDIEVDGVTVKTENIIDTSRESGDAASPITAMSPPPSEGSNNDDIILDDFFNSANFGNELEEPLDFTTGGPLDLSISGVNLKPPNWWEEGLSLGEGSGRGDMRVQDSGLHTPIAQSPAADADYTHPWAEDKAELDNAIASLDTDITHLFDLDSMHSSHVSVDS